MARVSRPSTLTRLAIGLTRWPSPLVAAGHVRHAPIDPDHWRFGALDVNRRDPALFVQARAGVGWTLNFGRPLAVLLLVALLAIGIGGPFYLAWLVMMGLPR